jgi:hypothetical protein
VAIEVVVDEMLDEVEEEEEEAVAVVSVDVIHVIEIEIDHIDKDDYFFLLCSFFPPVMRDHAA